MRWEIHQTPFGSQIRFELDRVVELLRIGDSRGLRLSLGPSFFCRSFSLLCLCPPELLRILLCLLCDLAPPPPSPIPSISCIFTITSQFFILYWYTCIAISHEPKNRVDTLLQALLVRRMYSCNCFRTIVLCLNPENLEPWKWTSPAKTQTNGDCSMDSVTSSFLFNFLSSNPRLYTYR